MRWAWKWMIVGGVASIVYGEPLHFHERFGREAAEDAQLVRYLANQVRRSVQLLVDRTRS